MKGFLQQLGFLFIIALYVVQVQAQENRQSLYQVIDAQSKKPVVYATVILKQAKRGVISDDNGNFRIPDLYQLNLDTLRVSSIGFKTRLIELKSQKNDVINIIELFPKTESLGEVTLVHKKNEKRISAGRVIKEAISRISDNYPVKPFSYLGYYRDYQQVADTSYLDNTKFADNNKYINLNEGIIQVFDAGFGTDRLTNGANQTVLYEFQKNKNFAVDSMLTIPYDNRKEKYLDGVVITPLGGNELNLLNLTNAIRNYNRMSFSFAHIFNRHFLGNHIFTHDGITYMDDEPIYRIQFILNKRATKPGYNAIGSVFISKEDFGIHRLNYKLYDTESKRLLYRIKMEYKKQGGRYYLNYITFNNYFKVKSEHYFKVEEINYDLKGSCFYFYFNETIASPVVKNLDKYIKFSIDQQEIKILAIQQIEPKVLKIKISTNIEIDKSIFNKEITYEIKHLKDVYGRLINEPEEVFADQFREFFVQEVFPNKPIEMDKEFVKKKSPLNQSKSHSLDGKDIYWINSPLKVNK
jgi:hypothetical protein